MQHFTRNWLTTILISTEEIGVDKLCNILLSIDRTSVQRQNCDAASKPKIEFSV